MQSHLSFELINTKQRTSLKHKTGRMANTKQRPIPSHSRVKSQHKQKLISKAKFEANVKQSQHQTWANSKLRPSLRHKTIRIANT
eukprot:1161785-Pelagomonas_calceolata.AAC.4